MWFWYRLNEREEAVLLRVFGTQPVLSLPDRIGGYPLTCISEYCFSEKEKYTGEEVFLRLADENEGSGSSATEEKNSCFFRFLREKKICALAGDFIREVKIPSSVKKIGALAFYQCRHLEKIFFGAGDLELGGDAFMNCRCLKKFFFYTLPEKPTVLRQILAQRNGETECYFLSPEDGAVTAALFFPEYSEKYDLIGPAHIFELNIEGEGFRARQCFENGVFLFQKYDRIFSQAVDTEEEKTLCKMAAMRLKFPFDLKEEKKEYLDYLLAHMESMTDWMIEEKETGLWKELGEQGNIRKKDYELFLKKVIDARWTEGVRMLLKWKEAWQKEKEEEEYGFEDF